LREVGYESYMLVARIIAGGIELLRRPDASPLAVLGFTVAAKAQAAAQVA
jgi:hypothetical protein